MNVVIIPVHNQLAYLEKCVGSVIAKTKDLKLIIVDDGSTEEDIKSWLKENSKEIGFDLLQNETAKGFTNAVNLGIQHALDNYGFTCLCLLNSDTRIYTEDWFDKVREYFENDEKVGLAGVMSDNALAQTVAYPRHYFANIDTKPTVYSYLLHGFCYFISKELLEKIGLLDEVLFPHYGSEDDYSLKSLSLGYHNLLVGSVFVHHANNKSYTEGMRQQIVRVSLPTLLHKWGKGMVDKCGVASLKAGNYINKR